MINSFDPDIIDQVVEAYLEACEIPSRETLSEWAHRYPKFERELMDITVAWIQMRTFPPAEPSHPESDDRSIQGGMSIVRKLLDDEQARSDGQPSQIRPIRALFTEASRRRLSQVQFASLLSFTTSILEKINYHLVQYESIPLHLIEAIADVLELDKLSVVAFLQRPAVIPQGAQFKSRQVPQVKPQEDFFDLIRTDPDLTEEQRKYWLMYEAKSR